MPTSKQWPKVPTDNPCEPKLHQNESQICRSTTQFHRFSSHFAFESPLFSLLLQQLPLALLLKPTVLTFHGSHRMQGHKIDRLLSMHSPETAGFVPSRSNVKADSRFRITQRLSLATMAECHCCQNPVSSVATASPECSTFVNDWSGERHSIVLSWAR